MTSEEYGQYIDDFELDVDVMPGESLTEYIERRRREFESKADGGSIGIEVFFKEKMKDGGRAGFFMGGPALEGTALSIYNSMNAYGFTDQEIANALQERGLYTPDGPSIPTPVPIAPEPGAQLNQGGGGITELQKTFTTETAPPQFTGDPTAQLTGKGRLDPMGSGFYETLESLSDQPTGYTMSTFNKDFAPSGEVVKNEPIGFNPETNPNVKKAFFQEVYQDPRDISFFDKVKDKFGSIKNKFFQPKVRGTLGTRLANRPRLPLPASIAAYSMSPFNPDSRNFNPLLEGQLNFLEGLENMIGRDPNTGGLKYGSGSVLAGKNVISGFGSNNYEVALNKYIQRMNRYENPTKKQQEKIAQAQAELAAEKERQIREAKTKAQALAAIQSQGKMDYNPNIHGPVDYGKDSQGNQSFDSGMGFGIGSDGGPVSNKTGRGRTGYSEGGLATMFTRRR